MAAFKEKLRSLFCSETFKKWSRRIAYFIGILFLLMLIVGASLAYYFNHNKAQIVSAINAKINQNISGNTRIGDFEYQFLRGFPNLTLDLKNVTIEDSLFKEHKHQLLNAKNIEVRLHLFQLLRHKIDFKKIAIKNATVYIFKDSLGYTNISFFATKDATNSTQQSESSFEISEISMENVRLILDNQLGNKMFDFDIAYCKAKPRFTNESWSSDLYIQTKIHSLAFNTNRGSFAKEQLLQGKFEVNYSVVNKNLDIQSNKLKIGTNNFDISSFFNFGKKEQPFQIDIKTAITWSNASQLLTPNISEKLNRFAVKKPFKVHCTLNGDLTVKDDPLIVVTADVVDDQVKIPDGTFTNCTFQGTFTNRFVSDGPLTNENSALTFMHFKASYHDIPFSVSDAKILNLDNPVVTGKVVSDFNMNKLNDPDNAKWLRFSGGNAKVDLDFSFGILDFYIRKPLFTGNVSLSNASFDYFPKNIKIEKTNMHFKFLKDALVIEEFAFKEHNTNIQMKGRVDNFLNLYYDAPEKIVVKWSVYSPRLDVKKFLAVLATPNKSNVSTKRNVSGSIQKVIEKSSVLLDIKADKMVYAKLSATDAVMKVKMDNSKLTLRNGFLKTAGGSIKFSGDLSYLSKKYVFSSDVTIANVEIASFLNSFNNFGITSFSPNNIKGRLFCNTSLTGQLNTDGSLMLKASKGKVNFKVKNGALVNFKPFVNIGQVAFPFRDVKNVSFSDLSADLSVNGENVAVNSMRATSNVINFDMNGVYSFGSATNLYLTVPLRNPKKDLENFNKEERELNRQKGIVLHLDITDVDGKIRVKLGKKHKEL